MAIGDGVRRNVAEISKEERDRLREAIRKLDMNKLFPDGVSFWDKQDQIHQATHVHGGAAFLPWHRELCNRFEALLREVDSEISLHYWDWTTDPRASTNGNGGTTNLFTNTFMGSASGRAGVPFDTFDNNNVLAGSRDQTGDPSDPPRIITRDVNDGNPGAPAISADGTVVTTGDALANNQQFPAMRGAVEGAHNTVHGYIGGTIGNGHTAFEDPFVFLLHSNVDRLWARWQTSSGKAWRLDPAQTYGNEGGSTSISENLEPWAGGTGTRPWAPPDNQQVAKNSKHRTVVAPPCYDTNGFLVRQGDSDNLAGFVSEITAIKLGTERVVTAVRTKTNTLKLISWQVNNNGSVSRTGDSGEQAGVASEIDIARGSKFVTACRTASSNLKLISWTVSNAGVITRAGDSGDQAGTASEIKIVALSNTLFVTACRTAEGDLKLISWRLNADGSVTRLKDSGSAAGAVSEVTITLLQSVNGGGRLVTSVRDSAGKLKLIVWNVTSAGVITRLGDSGSQAGAATMIRSVKDSFGHVVTSVRAGNGALKLIGWSISADGNTVMRLGDSGSQAGQIEDNALMSRSGGILVSAVRTAANTLKLISWVVTAGGTITRSGDSAKQAGVASLITLCQESLSGDAPIVTAVRTASNTLKLITWNA